MGYLRAFHQRGSRYLLLIWWGRLRSDNHMDAHPSKPQKALAPKGEGEANHIRIVALSGTGFEMVLQRWFSGRSLRHFLR